MAIDVRRAQEAHQPKDDLTPYAGQWVALRHGHVGAAAFDPSQLEKIPDVLDTDEIIPVGEPGADYFL